MITDNPQARSRIHRKRTTPPDIRYIHGTDETKIQIESKSWSPPYPLHPWQQSVYAMLLHTGERLAMAKGAGKSGVTALCQYHHEQHMQALARIRRHKHERLTSVFNLCIMACILGLFLTLPFAP